MKIKQSILVRVRLAFLGMALFAGLILLRILGIQVMQGEHWRQVAQDNGLKYRQVQATRGNILSDNGSFLATSLPFYQLAIDPTISEAQLFESSVDTLSKLFAAYFEEKPDTAYARELREARRVGTRYYVVSRKKYVSYQERKLLEAWPLIREGRMAGGAIFEKVDRRFRPYGALARRTVGFLINSDSTGELKGRGLEYSFNEALAGIDGEALYQRIAGGRWKPVDDESMIRTVNGHDVQTTLSLQIQEKATEILEAALKRHAASYGALVLMEVETGEVKALVNLGKESSGVYTEDYNYAVQGVVEPGSTMKTASMLALLEATNISITDTVDTEDGQYMFYDECVMVDANSYGYGRIPVQQIFEKSSNIGVSKLVFKHFQDRPDAFLAYLDRFGLTSPVGFQMQGEGVPVVNRPGSELWSGCSLPWLSIGYEAQIAPLQLLAFYNAIANQGKLVEPLLVKRILKGGHLVEKEFQARVIQEKICNERSLSIMQALLEGVVEHGTAQEIRTDAYRIAGKTGTTHKVQRGKYVDKYYTSFVGYFPAERPKYTCLVAIDEPKSGVHFGGDVAAPVFRELADWLFVRGVDHRLEEEPRMAGNLPRIQAGSYKDIQALCASLGLPSVPMNTENWVRTEAAGDTVQLHDNAFSEELVPDVRGMTLRDALYLMENRGLQVRIIGKGRVTKQSLYPGRRIQKGDMVYLTLG